MWQLGEWCTTDVLPGSELCVQSKSYLYTKSKNLINLKSQKNLKLVLKKTTGRFFQPWLVYVVQNTAASGVIGRQSPAPVNDRCSHCSKKLRLAGNFQCRWSLYTLYLFQVTFLLPRVQISFTECYLRIYIRLVSFDFICCLRSVYSVLLLVTVLLISVF